MKPFREFFARFLRETAPSERTVERVKGRIGREATDVQVSQAVLRHLPGVAPGAEARVRARMAAPAPSGSRRPWVYGGVTLAAAAAGLTVVVAMPEPGLAPVQAQLASDTERAELNPSPEVALAYQGAGSLEGTRQAPRIVWESGTVHVDVQPDQGIQLVVATPEAVVQVVGTAFAVTRDALGTQVQVDHGRVRVSCLDGAGSMLGAGEHTTCLPTTAAAMLTRANALQDQGASPEQLLATVALALERHPEPSLVRNELQTLQIQALARLGRASQAYGLSQAYLAAGHELRRDGMLILTARLAHETGGCDAATPWFVQLAAEQPSVPTLVKLADCQALVDPAAARDALEQAQDLEPDVRWAAAIEQRLGTL